LVACPAQIKSGDENIWHAKQKRRTEEWSRALSKKEVANRELIVSREYSLFLKLLKAMLMKKIYQLILVALAS
jgi:hypothetical protein